MSELLRLYIMIGFFFTTVHSMELKTSLRADRNILLRKRRYLEFPEGSNLVITFSFVKAVMVRKPKGYMSLLECDVPFPLPSSKDRREKHRFNYAKGREFTTEWSRIFDRLGMDGETCVNKFLCEAKSFIQRRGTSVISRIIQTILSQKIEENCCSQELLSQCHLPSLSEILTKILKLETFTS